VVADRGDFGAVDAIACQFSERAEAFDASRSEVEAGCLDLLATDGVVAGNRADDKLRGGVEYAEVGDDGFVATVFKECTLGRGNNDGGLGDDCKDPFEVGGVVPVAGRGIESNRKTFEWRSQAA
jgi:hypothetical protein